MMLRGTCKACATDVKVAWKDRDVDKGVTREQQITCPVCFLVTVVMKGTGGSREGQ